MPLSAAKVGGANKAKVKLGPSVYGPTSGRDALRRVLAASLGQGETWPYRMLAQTLPDRSESRRACPSLQPPEQQPLRIVKQQMMSSAELDKDNIVAAIGSARHQASTAQLGVSRFHAGKHRRSHHELVCRRQVAFATRTVSKIQTRQSHELPQRRDVIGGKSYSRHVTRSGELSRSGETIGIDKMAVRGSQRSRLGVHHRGERTYASSVVTRQANCRIVTAMHQHRSQ